jgi:hypothetical protein
MTALKKRSKMLNMVKPPLLSSREVWGLSTSDLLDYLEDLELIEILQGKLNQTVWDARFEVIDELRRRTFIDDPIDWGQEGI